MGWARINRYGEAETDSLLAGSMTHTITEHRDTLGRSTGYVYAKNDIPQQQTSIGYGADGRITGAGFTHQGEHKEFLYSYLPGTHLLHTLTHPNGLTLTLSYDATRDLPTQMDYSRADALVVQRAYDYDLLGRPTARDLARYGTQTSDTFGYNTRSELTTAHVNSADYSYAYDAIGNRTAATEDGTRTAYTANKLNQYTAEGSFLPTFDADGNQTLIKTSTGTWNVTYNAKNRPVRFVKSDNSVTVECTYDTMGRRATKKVTTNGTLTEHRRFLYRGYLQIDSPPPHRRLTPAGQSRFAHCPTGLTAVGRLACCDLTRAYTPALWFITWESPRRLGGGLDKHEVFAPKGRAGNGVPASQPTQETATRPLAIQKNGTWYTYGWDLTKNICETYRTDARIDLAYTYTPYGEVSPAHAYDQPLRWSSEYHDVESPRRLGGGLDKHEVFAPKGRAPKGVGASQLGLVYYNYRHYNPAMGRWMRRDMLNEAGGLNIMSFAKNRTLVAYDFLGLWLFTQLQEAQDKCCRSKKSKNVFISASDYKSIAKIIPEPKADSLIETILNSVTDCECISELQIIVHGDKDFFLVDSFYNHDTLTGKAKIAPERVDANNAGRVFSKIKDKMCSTCIIFMDSCHLGLGSIPQIIANETQCTVRAAKGFCRPASTQPRLSTSNNSVDGFTTKYPDLAQSTFAYFSPQPKQNNQ